MPPPVKYLMEKKIQATSYQGRLARDIQGELWCGLWVFCRLEVIHVLSRLFPIRVFAHVFLSAVCVLVIAANSMQTWNGRSMVLVWVGNSSC